MYNKASAMLTKLVVLGLIATGADATCHTNNDDCSISFGPWSHCDPCTKQQSRHARIITPPQFDGIPCPENFVEHRFCTPTSVCPSDLPCPGQFDCGYLSRCVNDTLVCNGDDDCGNNADEQNCTKSEFYQRSILECLNLDHVPYLDQIGSGVHLISGKLAGRVVDNQRYQGFCRKAVDGDKQKVYRLPYNVDNFHFHVKTTDDLQVSSYSSLSQYTKELDKEQHTSWSKSASAHGGFGIFGAKLSGSITYTHSSTFKDLFKAMKDQEATLFRVSTQIQTAEFILKGNKLLLDGFFEQRINRLPTSINPKSYFDFFAQYGVSYLHSGVLGGKYEHFYIFSKEQMKKSHQTTSTLSECLKRSLSASLGFGSFFGASGSYHSSKCSSTTEQELNSWDVANSAAHKVVNIDGGTSEMAGKLAGAAMLGNGTFQVTKFEQWVMGVQQNPMLLMKTVRPICDLILSSKDPHKQLKHGLCLNATTAYLQPFSTEACRACKNGRPINMNGKCQCACDDDYTGQTCATTFAPPLSMSGVRSNSNPDTASDIKLLTVNGTAENPPYMQWRNVGPYDSIIKMKENRLFLLASTQGTYVFGRNGTVGEYRIQEYDEFLQPVHSTKVDFTTIDHCNKGTGFCIVRDFDVDMHGNFIISVKIGTQISSSVCKLDKSGKAILQIQQLCAMDDSNDPMTAYVTTTCSDQIVVSCPSLSPATVKVYSSEGHPQHLTQFSGYQQIITGIQHFNQAVWIHTLDNKVAAYDLTSWDKVFAFAGVSTGQVGGPQNYCQTAVDFVGNLIVGQAQNHEPGKLNYKFTIVQGASGRVLAYVKLTRWNNCLDVATYRGKLYTLCERRGDATQKAILIFDYLK